MEAERRDIVIVGGGLAGAGLACMLRGSGLKVALLEAVGGPRAAPPGYDERGLVLSPASRRILTALGLWEALAGAACPVEHIHVSERGRFAFTHLSAAGEGVDALGHVVRARAIGEALQAGLEGEPDLDWVAPARVTAVEPEAGGMTVRAATDAGERCFHARLLVVADGAASPSRRMLGVEVEEKDYGQVAVVCSLTPGRPHRNTAFERFTETGPLALLPQREGHCVCVNTVAAGEAEAVLALEDKAYLAQVQERFGYRLGRLRRPGRRSSYPLRLVWARRQVGPRWVLLGNAAHAIHPNAAQGLNLALRDAAALAEGLWQAARSGADPGRSELLDAYRAAREPDQKRIRCLSDGLATLFYN
ncbi:MAG: 2-octaprenyl-6-methoxyphenyl hydroxylase, partial [Gammaproteobacteria bacterium]